MYKCHSEIYGNTTHSLCKGEILIIYYLNDGEGFINAYFEF